MGNIDTPWRLQERTLIPRQLARGVNPAAIAVWLNRSASTRSRELRRNGWTRSPTRRGPGRPPVAGGYRADAAPTRAQACTGTPRVARRLQPGTACWAQVLRYLKMGDSPEQMAGLRACVNSHTPTVRVSHEPLSPAIYAMPRGERRTAVIGWLRVGHAKRRPRVRGTDRRGQIPDMVSIHARPSEVDERLVPGPWEGDFIKGAQNRSAVETLGERTPLFTVWSRMDDASAESALSGFSPGRNRIERQKRLSLTYDQGREMAAHQRLTEATGVKVYFADPHSPWQRGINENTNGLLRQYLPKGSDLSGFTQEELDAIAWTLNTRPRKSLGCRCPAEWFTPGAFDFRPPQAALFALGT